MKYKIIREWLAVALSVWAIYIMLHSFSREDFQVTFTVLFMASVYGFVIYAIGKGI